MERARKWLRLDLFGPEAERAPRAMRRAAESVVLAVRALRRHDAFHHASSLSFDTVLAVVPLVVIAFAMLRGLGAYEAFSAQTVRPWLERSFGSAIDEASPLRDAFVRLLELGEGVNLAALGFLGIVLLLYLVVVLLTTVETTLDRIWGVHRPRRWVRRAADYAAILFVIPLAMLFATVAAQALGRATWLRPAEPVPSIALTVICASGAMAFLYLVMPNTRVRVSSALFGGGIAGALWSGAFFAYATFQIGAARYDMLYSGFAAIPLFLVFVFASWLVVLFGAELAAAHQSPSSVAWRLRERDPSTATRHRLAVRFMLEAARAFAGGTPPPTLEHLASVGHVPEQLARALLEELVAAGILVHAVVEQRPAYGLGRDPRSLHLTDILAAIDEPRGADVLDGSDAEAARIDELLRRVEGSRRESEADVDLATLVSK